jgi:hypothetical protein
VIYAHPLDTEAQMTLNPCQYDMAGELQKYHTTAIMKICSIINRICTATGIGIIYGHAISKMKKITEYREVGIGMRTIVFPFRDTYIRDTCHRIDTR